MTAVAVLFMGIKNARIFPSLVRGSPAVTNTDVRWHCKDSMDFRNYKIKVRSENRNAQKFISNCSKSCCGIFTGKRMNSVEYYLFARL